MYADMRRFNTLFSTGASLSRVFVLLCAVLALESATVMAQRISLRAGGGGLVLTRPDDLDAFLGSGTNLMLDLSVQPLSASFPGLEIVTESTFDRFTTNESDLLIFYPNEVVEEVASVDGADLSFFASSLALRYTIVNADIPSKPYVSLGAGVYHYQYRPSTFFDANGAVVQIVNANGEIIRLEGDKVISTAFGWKAGFGLDFDITETYGFFIEAQYVVVRGGEYGDAVTDVRAFETDDTTRYYPIRFGATIRLASFGSPSNSSPEGIDD